MRTSNLHTLDRPTTALSSSEGRGFSIWILWAFLLFIGILMMSVPAYLVQRQSGSHAVTLKVASRFQATASNMKSEAVLAAVGTPGSLDRMDQQRQSLMKDIGLLRGGGFDEPSDSYPVMALAPYSSIPLTALTGDFQKFTQSVQPMLGASDALSQAAEAEAGLSKIVTNIRRLSPRINSSTRLMQGEWGNALRPVLQDLTRKELDGMGAVFSPSEGGKVLAKQWSDLFAQRARDAKTLSDVAQKDLSLSQTEREWLKELASQSATLSKYAQQLVATNDIRLKVRDSITPVRNAADALQASANKLVSGVSSLGKTGGSMAYIFYAGILISLIGLIGTVRTLWSMGYERWRIQQENMKGVALYQSVEKLTRDLRKITNLETSEEKVPQSPDSPIFPLLSMINQALVGRSEAAGFVEDNARDLQKILFDVDQVTAAAGNNVVYGKDILSALSSSVKSQALDLAGSHEKIDNTIEQVSGLVRFSHKSDSLAQEASWRMTSLRENTQSMAKRIKRLGENTQSIHVSSDTIKDMTRRIKVLALNLAIEAAGSGEHGKIFATLANELERLAQNAEDATKDIESQIQIIQADAKDTVDSVETGIGDVVEITKLSSESFGVLKEQQRALEFLQSDLQLTLSSIHQSAIALSTDGEKAQEVSQKIEGLDDDMQRIRSRTAEMRSVLKSSSTWLSNLGRRI